MRKNSPFTKFFNNKILKILENGQLDLYRFRNSQVNTQCNPPKERGDALGFSKLISLFAMLVCGICLSLIMCLFECAKKSRKIDTQENHNNTDELLTNIEDLIGLLMQIHARIHRQRFDDPKVSWSIFLFYVHMYLHFLKKSEWLKD